MPANIAFKQFLEFAVSKDPETVCARPVKYAERYNSYHGKAYNITDKAQPCKKNKIIYHVKEQKVVLMKR